MNGADTTNFIVVDATQVTDLEGTALSITAGVLNVTEADPTVDTADEIEAILTNDAFDFGTGTLASGALTVTGLISSSVGIDAVGDVDFDIGSADVDDITLITDGGTWIFDDTLTFPDANVAPDAAGELVYDNTVTGLEDGAFAWYDDDAVRYLVDLATLPSDDDYVVTYDADADGFYMKTDSTGGNTAYNSIGDPTGVGLITFDDGETATYDGANDDEVFFTLSNSVVDLSADTTMLKITAVDNDDANYIPFGIFDDSDGTEDTLFLVDYTGAVTTGEWKGTEIADAYVPDNITIDLATLATTLTITDNENTAENNAVLFTSAGDLDGGNLGIESDGDFYYTPSTGTVTATTFVGAFTGNLTGNADTVTTNANLTGDVTSTGNATSIAANVVDFTDILYTNTLAGNPALASDECFWISTAAGGGFICEGSTADTAEQIYQFPDVNGADTTNFIVVDATQVTDLEGTALSITAGVLNVTEADPTVDTADEIEAILTNDAFDFGTGTLASGALTVTGLISSSVGIDAVGDVDFDIGSADVDDITLITDGGTFIFDNGLTALGEDLGSATAEWNNLYLNDGGVIQMGDDQDVTITHVADTGILINLEVEIDGTLDADGIVALGDGGDNFSIASDGIDIDISGNITNAGTISSGAITVVGDTVTTGDVVSISADGLTTGSGLKLESTSQSGSEAKLAEFLTTLDSTTPVTSYGLYTEVTSSPGYLGGAGDHYGNYTKISDLAGSRFVNLYGTASEATITSNIGSGTGTLTAYGDKITTSVTGASSSGITTNSYGVYSSAIGTHGADVGTVNTYGGYFDATGSGNGTSTAYGIYATAGSAVTNWALYTAGGNVTLTVDDNNTDAFDLQESTNNYININTTNGSENISFGNVAVDPTYTFLGDGAVTITGVNEDNDALTLTHGDITISDGDLNISAGGISATSDATSTTAFNFNAGSVTLGTGLALSAVNLAGGEALDITATTAPTAGQTNEVIDINITHTPTTSADTFSGIDLNVAEGANALANTVYGLQVTTDNSSNTSTGTHSVYSGYFSTIGKTAGTTTAYGIYATATGADTNYAAYFSGDVAIVRNDADGVGLTITPSVATTTAIDVSDTDITNAIKIGTNTILGSGSFTIDLASADATTLTIDNSGAGAPTLSVVGNITNTTGSIYPTAGDLGDTNGYSAGTTDALCDSGVWNLVADCDGAPQDYAEYYATIEGVEPGDIVVLDPENYLLAVKSEKIYDSHMIGIISTMPNITIGEVIPEEQNPQPVALKGRIPVKINLENGPIQVGDRLTSSSVPGVAMKAVESGPVIGIALESYDGSQQISDGVAKVHGFLTEDDPQSIREKGEGLGKTEEEILAAYEEFEKTRILVPPVPQEGVGKVMAFINISYYIDTEDIEKMNTQISADSDGIIDSLFDGVSDIAGFFKGGLESLGLFVENGIAQVTELFAEKITTQIAKVDRLEMVDQATGQIYCTWIENGDWKKVSGECSSSSSQPLPPSSVGGGGAVPPPAPQEPPAEEPAVPEPPVEEPVVEEPPVEEPQPEPPVEEPAPQEPPAEEPAATEPPVEEPVVEEPPAPEPQPEPPAPQEPQIVEEPPQEPPPPEPLVEEPQEPLASTTE
ncbi:beta strand repeat-containing protein [Patescibacteria group bacterium]